MNALVRYEQARTALAECARIDEASEIRDKASALAAYARQRDDRDLEVWVREIHLRACVRIGELSRELERADHGGSGGGSKFPAVGTSKAQALADAGLSTSTAHRYEELAGGREEQAVRQTVGQIDRERVWVPSRDEFVELVPDALSASEMREAGNHLLQHGADCIRRGRLLLRLADMTPAAA